MPRPAAGSGDEEIFSKELSLRKRFYLVLILIGVTLFTGMSTGFELFYRLIYVLALTAIFSFVWNWLSIRSLEVTVQRRTPRVNVGDMVEERISIRNLSSFPRPVLEIEDLTDLPGYSSGMATSLMGKGFRTWRAETPARKRGVYTMGPVRVANSDAFGLFRRERTFGESENLIVYPRAFDVPGFAITAAALTGESTTRRRGHYLTPHAASVRDYTSGDSISRVHWNSTARLGKLMSKEFDLETSSDVWLLVDLHETVQAGELEESTDEYAVSIAASLAKRYLQAHLPVGLIAYGDERYLLPSETGAGQFDRIMEFLALTRADGSTPLEDVLPKEERLWGYHSSLIVITPSHRPEWVRAIRALSARGVRVAAILLDGRSFGGSFDSLQAIPALYEAGIAPYVVGKGDDIPVALGRTYTSSELDRSRDPERAGAAL